MPIKYLSQSKNKNWKDETCLVRVDLNVEDGKDGVRLKAIVPTVDFLIKAGAKVVLLSHRGRPIGFDRKDSLKVFIPILSKLFGTKVKFFDNLEFDKIKVVIDSEKAPSIFLIENLRFLRGEVDGDELLAKNLASLGTCYINDAFAVSHRPNTSVTLLPQLLPHYAGFLLEQEITTLTKIMKNPEKPLVLVLGGAKISDKINIIENFAEVAEYILIAGGIANTFFAAQDMNIGESLYEPTMVDWTKRFLLTKTAKKIVLPADWVKDRNRIVDIGPLTAEIFGNYAKKAKTVVWNGPLGKFETERFRRGSLALAKAIIASKAFSVAGGGETSQLLFEAGLADKFSFVSTGGGAMLDFLSGKELPGIEVLKG